MLSWKPQPVSLCNPECLSGIRSGLNLVLDQFESGCLGPLCMWYSLFCFYMFNTQRGLGVDLGLNNIGEGSSCAEDKVRQHLLFLSTQ